MKKPFEFKPRTAVAAVIGAALFALLFTYVKVPTGIPETDVQTAYGIGAFFAALFGPVAGFLVAFIGHAVSDAVQYGSPWWWWSWVVTSGVACFIVGLVYPRLKVDEGQFSLKDALLFNIYQIAANAIAWILVAPLLDIIVYSEPSNLVFTQGAVAALSNAVSMGVIGTLLLFLYAKIRSGKGSHSQK